MLPSLAWSASFSSESDYHFTWHGIAIWRKEEGVRKTILYNSYLLFSLSESQVKMENLVVRVKVGSFPLNILGSDPLHYTFFFIRGPSILKNQSPLRIFQLQVICRWQKIRTVRKSNWYSEKGGRRVFSVNSFRIDLVFLFEEGTQGIPPPTCRKWVRIYIEQKNEK